MKSRLTIKEVALVDPTGLAKIYIALAVEVGSLLEKRRTPEYCLMNSDDYNVLCSELRMMAWGAAKSEPAHLAKIENMFAFPMPDIPRTAEHSDAHIAFAAAGYDKLPVPAKGTALILFW